MDLAQAVALADTAEEALQEMRNKSEEQFREIFRRAESVATGSFFISFMQSCSLIHKISGIDKTASIFRYLCHGRFYFTGLELSIEMPRRCGRQLYRTNTPASTPEEYFRIAVVIPFLDSFLMQMQFLAHRNLLSCFSSLLPRADMDTMVFNSNVAQQATVLHSTYSKHLESGEAEFIGEMKLYYRHVANLKVPPKTALQALKV